MGELCHLGFYSQANKKPLWNEQVPRDCQDCLQQELDKPTTQIQLATLGMQAVVQVIAVDKPIRIGITFNDVHGRTARFEEMNAAADEAEPTTLSVPFYCARALAGVAPKKADIEDVGPNEYL